RNGSHRAATAQEEVVSLTGTAWHGSATFVLSNDGHAGLCGRQGCTSKDKPVASRSTNSDDSLNKVTQGEAVIPSMRVVDEEIARARGSYIRSPFPNALPPPRLQKSRKRPPPWFDLSVQRARPRISAQQTATPPPRRRET